MKPGEARSGLGRRRLVPFYGIALPLAVAVLSLNCAEQGHANLVDALRLYQENRLEQARPLFEEIVADRREDAAAHAWLAETYRRLGMKSEAVRTAERALQLDPRSSFAHTVMADACRRPPGDTGLSDSDTTWAHLGQAIECDSTDGNAWTSIWCEAILREKFDLMQEAARRMEITGFLTPAALAYGRWMLRTLPKEAILITNGDMDTFTPMAVQEAEGFRRDIVVVERGVLGTRQFQRFIRDARGVPLSREVIETESPPKSEIAHERIQDRSRSIFDAWIKQAADGLLERPIAVAATVDRSFYHHVEDHLVYSGPFFLWQATPADGSPDTTAVAASLEGIRSEEFAGPWVSAQDRSPVRRTQTKRLAANVTAAALVYAEALIDAKKASRAKSVLGWAREFEGMTELGPVFTERISELEEAAGR